jgi:hypothetical protein
MDAFFNCTVTPTCSEVINTPKHKIADSIMTDKFLTATDKARKLQEAAAAVDPDQELNWYIGNMTEALDGDEKDFYPYYEYYYTYVIVN